jgi:hypothetical protein
MAVEMQKKLEMGELIHNEIKSVLGFKKDGPIISMASVKSKILKNYLRLSAFRTCDEKVIRFAIQ